MAGGDFESLGSEQLAVSYAACSRTCLGGRGKCETVGEIITVAGDEAHAGGVAVRNDGRRA